MPHTRTHITKWHDVTEAEENIHWYIHVQPQYGTIMQIDFAHTRYKINQADATWC